MFVKKIFSVMVLLLFVNNVVYAQLTPEQQAAKDKGLMLYNQHKAISAVPFLTEAAEAGDQEAQFILGEALRKNNRYMTSEANRWYVAAANQGDFYAMLRLSRESSDLCEVMNNCPPSTKTPEEWLEQAREIGTAQAKEGRLVGMYIMYLATGDLEWLERSAEAGYPQAQRLLASRYKEGKGFFILPWARQEAVEKWLKASAEGGNPRGMMEYVTVLYESGDMEGARHWIAQASETGFEGAIVSYGAYLAHEPDKVGYPLDRVKGYGLLSLLRELDGGGNVQVYLDDVLPVIAAKMTPEQIEEAEAFAAEWKATHPPLSFFPEKLGF
ncbi:sel1 repeat family protein [Pseudomonas neustonica]|uniref:Sel1 repeat family protein n=1 Tax=Pseudomonas neustonica TaxID=2487346 RepID=A0ABX9XCF3_9PSED|nr:MULTISPECIES: sel1 repeat family protein [Pseudomonas]ROZ79298.1 sel1 repeat family protein [Pseudomonas sp. SSM44]ROZ80259.1 sel1 repeat family protein [Pseudomonas neustonica]|tara:strand:- start:1396 stop:2376 length:981 start_codon:yes stop_codon:yes gene_type:complete